MKENVIPTLSNCQQLCIKANKDWQNVIKESTKNALAIIDWRVHYSQLDNFDLPKELLKVIDIQYFKKTYEQSAYLYYKLLEEKEYYNTTERVEISMLRNQNNQQLCYTLLTAVSPKNIDKINTKTIMDALNDPNYQAIYIEDRNYQLAKIINGSFGYYIGTDNRLYPISKNPPLRQGLLIISSNLNDQLKNHLIDKSAKVQIDRIK